VAGEYERTVQQPVSLQVVDVAAVAEGEFDGLVLGASLSDPARQLRDSVRSSGEVGDGVDDLGVPGAAAEVGTEPALDGRPIQCGALLIDECLHANQDAGDAETTLQCTVGGEGLGEPCPVLLRETLERRDVPPRDLVQGRGATDPRLPIDEHCAGSALAGGGTAIFRGCHTEFLAQGGEQVLVSGAYRDLSAVQAERDRLRPCRCHVTYP